MTDSPRDEVTLTKSSVGVSGSASDEQVSELDFVKIREVAERFLSIDSPPSSPGEVHLARDVVALSERLVGLSADVSRLTEAWVEDVKRLGGVIAVERARVAVLREALEAIVGQATDLPHAGRIDRDEMRSIARAALAALPGSGSGVVGVGEAEL